MGDIARGAARAGRAAREIILSVLALGGVACIVLVILAFTGGYSLIMFKTGSMSPTIPAGSVALVEEVPATDLKVGDVVTIDRPDALPITHRITNVSDGPSIEERTITMRGDANEAEDPLPYTVSDARIVRGSVPHLANVIVWFGNPFVLGGITVGAAVLVTWAFWPREPRSVPVSTSDEPRTRRERRAAGLALVGVLMGVGATVWAPQPTEASTDILRIQSDLDSNTTYTLDAAEPLLWHVDVDASTAPSDGELYVKISGTGSEALGLSAEVRSCAAIWTPAGCNGDERVLQAATLLALNGARTELLREETPTAVHLRIALTASGAPDAVSAAASVTIQATAGQTVVDTSVNGDDDLPETGGQSWWFLAAPAAVLVGIGIALLVAAKRRHRE